MKTISVVRKVFTDKSTVGRLSFEGFECFTLEDTVRNRDRNNDGMLQKGEKIWGQTAIPAGSYFVEIRQSKRFKRPMPYLLNVPYFDAIMIHLGNMEIDTKGCLLVGMKHSAVDTISESRVAFDKLFPLIENALKDGAVKINISGGYSADDLKERLIV